MRNATIRQFQIFSVAATHLSFARAAEQLHLTQAAVSLQIKQLEEVSGVKLFDRIGKRIFMTEAGEILLAYARQILQALRDADTSLSSLKELKGGRLTLAVTSTAEYFAPGILAEFQKKQADIEVRLLIENRSEVARLLLANEVDLAIMGRPPANMEAETVSMAPHPFVIICNPAHPLAKKRQISVKDIANMPMIVREIGSGTRTAMEGFFRENDVEPSIGMEMGSNEAIKQAVIAGLGISFISRHTLGLELSAERLKILKVEGTPVIRHWLLVRHKSKRQIPAVEAFWNFVIKFAPDYLRDFF